MKFQKVGGKKQNKRLCFYLCRYGKFDFSNSGGFLDSKCSFLKTSDNFQMYYKISHNLQSEVSHLNKEMYVSHKKE